MLSMIQSVAMKRRHSKRAFLDQPIEQALIYSVLNEASQAPSSKNTQPWEVAIVTGATKQALSDTICTKFDQGIADGADYTYSPDPLPDEWKARARACGYALFDLKGIARDDRDARQAHARENFTFFGAPMVMIFHTVSTAQNGTFLDMGCFLQTVMLELSESGLGSCPQFSVATYADTIRDVLKLSSDRLIVCGLSVGYPDETASVNTFIPERLSVDDFTTTYD